MSTVTRREAQPTEIMEPLMDGSWRAYTVPEAHLWRCDGCGYVWQKKWHAETCESRGHVGSFTQGPYGVWRVENGQAIPFPGHQLNYYVRNAVRKEELRGASQSKGLVQESR